MLAKIWNYKAWITETDPKKLQEAFDKILKDAGFTILSETEHYFTPQGYTKLYLLCESHFAIHTFPEFGKAYIELSSCNKEMYEKAIMDIKQQMCEKNVEYITFE